MTFIFPSCLDEFYIPSSAINIFPAHGLVTLPQQTDTFPAHGLVNPQQQILIQLLVLLPFLSKKYFPCSWSCKPSSAPDTFPAPGLVTFLSNRYFSSSRSCYLPQHQILFQLPVLLPSSSPDTSPAPGLVTFLSNRFFPAPGLVTLPQHQIFFQLLVLLPFLRTRFFQFSRACGIPQIIFVFHKC